MTDPKHANEYDDRGARGAYSVLLEIGQVLGAYRDRFVIIGGSVPWLLFPDAQPPHVGTMDVDLSLDADALGDGVAMRSFLTHKLDGTMPDGRPNSLEIRVASIPALLVMKGYAIAGRDKQKDAYDIYFSVREFEGGPDVLAQECALLLSDAIALRGFQNIAEKFSTKDSYGPVTVRRFLSESAALGDMTEDQVQVDAYEQVRAWLTRLGL